MIYGFSKKLILLRQNKKMSQSEVARRINVSHSAVSAYESDEILPSLETFMKLVELYNTSADYLLSLNYPRDTAILDTSGLNKQQLVALQNLIDTMK